MIAILEWNNPSGVNVSGKETNIISLESYSIIVDGGSNVSLPIEISDVNGLQNNLNTLEQNIDNEIVERINQYDAINTSIVDLNENIQLLSHEVSIKADVEALNTVSSDVIALTEQLSLKVDTDVYNIDKEFTNQSIGLKAEKTYVDSSLSDITLNLESVQDTVNNLNNTKVDTDVLNTIVSDINQNISLKSDKIYVDQRFADLIGNAPETLDTIADLATAFQENSNVLGDLVLVNESKVSFLPQVLDQNQKLQVRENIGAEASGVAADLVASEIAVRLAADTALQNAITVEASTRASVDTALQYSIDANTTEISAEATARTSADSALSVRLDPVESKLSGIAAGATANATDAQLRDRSTHTGTQAISTVTGLQSALDFESLVRANADISLQSNLNTESSIRADADAALQSNIIDESTARQTADATLQTDIDSKEPAIAVGTATQYWTGLKNWATLSWSAIQSIPTALSQIVGLNPSDDDILQRKSGGWVNRTIAQLKLDIGIGTTADKINNLCQLYMLENTIGIPTYMSSFNEPWFLQNNLSQHTVRILQANGLGGTTFSQLGLSAYTTFGTTTGVANAQGSEWLQLPRSAMAVSGVNTIAGWYTTALTHYYPAANINFGHVMSIGFGVRDNAGGSLIPDARMFVGETTSITNPTNVEPKTMTNAIGVIQSTTLPNPNNLYFYVNGSSSAGYLFDTGIAVSLTTGYRLTIFNIKGTRKVLMRLSDINTDAAVNHVIDINLLPANQQPLSTAGYGTRLWRASANNTIGTPLQIVLSKIYLEGKN